MDQQRPHRHPRRNRRTRTGSIVSRPDRVALWAVFMAVIAMVAAAASAQAASGGLGDPSVTGEDCRDGRLGQRVLSFGDCGEDVRTLNWILRSKSYAVGAPLGRDFETRTARSVKRFQDRVDLASSGVVDGRTSRRLVRSMRRDVATWYGPGFYGARTACGRTLTRKTVGVAHRRLPCGTRVTLRYRGRFLRTRVIDRGPYSHGARWDLTARAAAKLRLETTDRLRSAIAR